MGKIMELKEAVARFIDNGSHIAIGGFCTTRNPMAITYEIIRQNKNNLHLYVHSHGQSLDLLIGAGLVKRVEIAYAGMGRFAPTCVRFRKAVQTRKVEWEDYTNFQMSLRFLAGALGVPFIPCKTGFGSDIMEKEGFSKETRRERKVAKEKLVVVENPFSNGSEKVIMLPAINADVAIIHAKYAGEKGTVRIEGLKLTDVEIARCADRLIVSCEEIVPESYLRENPDLNCLPGFLVDAIVKVSYGAHPTSCFGAYDYDAKHLHMYRHVAEHDEEFKRYLDEWIYGVETHEEYLKKVGIDRLLEIKSNPAYGFAYSLDRR